MAVKPSLPATWRPWGLCDEAQGLQVSAGELATGANDSEAAQKSRPSESRDGGGEAPP